MPWRGRLALTNQSCVSLDISKVYESNKLWLTVDKPDLRDTSMFDEIFGRRRKLITSFYDILRSTLTNRTADFRSYVDKNHTLLNVDYTKFNVV